MGTEGIGIPLRALAADVPTLSHMRGRHPFRRDPSPPLGAVPRAQRVLRKPIEGCRDGLIAARSGGKLVTVPAS
jgi:hypothetical protein